MKKLFIIGFVALFSLGVYAFWQYSKFNDGKLHVIFCDVGQGDAILIKTPNNKFILYDGGPDRRVLHCLAKHMPFWNRQIDMMVLSHPHADHFFGMFYVLERYQVKSFATEELMNKTQAFEELLNQIDKNKIPRQYVMAGDLWDVGGVQIEVVGPTQEYLERTSPGGTIGESKEFASLVLKVSYGDFDALLTGDSQVQGLQDANTSSIDVLHVPHHGSGSGLEKDVLEQLEPTIAVVSVGAENRYNHPHPRIMELLQSLQIQTFRTDQDGDIMIISDGIGWKVVK